MAEYNIKINNKINGSKDTLYPITKADNVKIASTENLPSGMTTSEDVFNALGDMAFDDGDNLIYLGSEAATGSDVGTYTEVNDNTVSTTSTWSSAKLKQLFESLGVKF